MIVDRRRPARPGFPRRGGPPRRNRFRLWRGLCVFPARDHHHRAPPL